MQMSHSGSEPALQVKFPSISENKDDTFYCYIEVAGFSKI
jgi:hypothetical protein